MVLLNVYTKHPYFSFLNVGYSCSWLDVGVDACLFILRRVFLRITLLEFPGTILRQHAKVPGVHSLTDEKSPLSLLSTETKHTLRIYMSYSSQAQETHILYGGCHLCVNSPPPPPYWQARAWFSLGSGSFRKTKVPKKEKQRGSVELGETSAPSPPPSLALHVPDVVLALDPSRPI